MHAKIHEDDVHCKTNGKYEELTFLSARISRRISSREPTAASLPGCRRLVGGTATLIKPCRYPTTERRLGEYRPPTNKPGPHCPVGYLGRGLELWNTYPTPAWQVARETNSPISFPLNCSQKFSASQRSFRAQQRLGDSWLHGRATGYAPLGACH